MGYEGVKFFSSNGLLWSKNNTFKLYLIDHIENFTNKFLSSFGKFCRNRFRFRKLIFIVKKVFYIVEKLIHSFTKSNVMSLIL